LHDRTNADEEEKIKHKILELSLKHVNEHGWSKQTISTGAQDGGLLATASGIFPEGGDAIVFFHVRKSNQILDKWMEVELAKYKEKGIKPPVRPFIKSAIKERLAMNETFIRSGRWEEALAILARPQNICMSGSLLQELCDDIWHRAGDTSADMNWYSKRMLLAAIITSTEVFMLKDTSTDFEETWRFLERRFEDVGSIPNMASLPQDALGLMSGVLTTAKNMIGFQR